MMAGTAIPVKIQEYAAVSMHLKTKDEIFSAMVVYGFLSYKNGKVFIPNKELMDKFADMIRREPSLGYVYRRCKPCLSGGQRHVPGGKRRKSGHRIADFLFYPEVDKSADCIILELKIDHTPDEAIRQIEDKNYALCFRGKTAEAPKFTGKIRAVGIGYSKKTKKHSCKVKIL